MPVHSLAAIPRRVVAIRRNKWSQSIGTGGRNQSVRAVAINRNGWSRSVGARNQVTISFLTTCEIEAQNHPQTLPNFARLSAQHLTDTVAIDMFTIATATRRLLYMLIVPMVPCWMYDKSEL